MDTFEFTLQAESIEELFRKADERVGSVVKTRAKPRFSSVVIIAVGEKGHVDGEFVYDIPGSPSEEDF